MNSSNEFKVCANGENCLHLKQDGSGKLPLWAFNDYGEKNSATRPTCKVCTSFRASCQDGAKNEIASAFADNFKLAMKDLMSKRTKSVNAFEAAVLLGVSESKVGSLEKNGYLTPNVTGGGEYDKAVVLELSNRAEILAKYRKTSSWDHWSSRSRVTLSNKQNPRFVLVLQEQSSVKQLSLMERDQAELLTDSDDLVEGEIVEVAEYFLGQTNVRRKYREGVNELFPMLQPHAQAMGVSLREYLKFIAPKLYEALNADEEFIARYESNEISKEELSDE